VATSRQSKERGKVKEGRAEVKGWKMGKIPYPEYIFGYSLGHSSWQ